MFNGFLELVQEPGNNPVGDGGYKRCAGSYRGISQVVVQEVAWMQDLRSQWG